MIRLYQPTMLSSAPLREHSIIHPPPSCPSSLLFLVFPFSFLFFSFLSFFLGKFFLEMIRCAKILLRATSFSLFKGFNICPMIAGDDENQMIIIEVKGDQSTFFLYKVANHGPNFNLLCFIFALLV